MNAVELTQLIPAWQTLQKITPLGPILTEEDYLRTVEILNLLMDDVRDSADHPLFSLMGIVGELIESYEAGLTPVHLQLNA